MKNDAVIALQLQSGELVEIRCDVNGSLDDLGLYLFLYYDKEEKVKELIQMGILSSGAKVRLSHCEKVKKAYPAYFDTYAEMPKLRRWLDGIGNLYCIGRNGQHRYNNMDHSMLTAMPAVDCLFDEKKYRKAIWQVNTEKEYHEEG